MHDQWIIWFFLIYVYIVFIYLYRVEYACGHYRFDGLLWVLKSHISIITNTDFHRLCSFFQGDIHAGFNMIDCLQS